MTTFNSRKFVVLRADGSRPSWPEFVLNLNDESGYIALSAYINHYSTLKDADPDYVSFLYGKLSEAEEYMEGRNWSRPDKPSQQDATRGPVSPVVEALLDGAPDLAEALAEALPGLVSGGVRRQLRRAARALVRLVLL